MLAIAVAACAVYAGSMHGALMFDDLGTVVRNLSIQHLSDLGAILAPPSDSPVSGRPLVNLSFALNYALGGTSPVCYHAVNLALHVACALLLFVVIRRWSTTALAFGATLLWTVHPLNSEVVSYITQRTESMMALCALATLYAAQRGWRVAAVVACAAGMLCKETMAVVPLAVVLCDWAYGGVRSVDALRARAPFYAALAATWAVLVGMLVLGGQTTSAGFTTAQVSVWTYLLNQPGMILHYLRLAVWPSGLVLYYGWPVPLTLGMVWPQVLVVAALVVAACVALVRWPRVGALAVWVFLWLGPTSSLIPIATEVGAERRMYLPLMGLVLLVLMSLAWAARRISASARALPAAVVAIAAVALGATTYARTLDYATPLTMANTVLAYWPTPNAHQLVGTELVVANRHEEAVPHLRIAAEGYPPARLFLGEALFGAGQFMQAVPELEQFIRDEPTLAPVRARMVMAKAYGSTNNMPKAIEQLQLVLAAEPTHAEAHGLLAEALMQQRAFADAVPHYEAFLKTNSRNANGWSQLGVALASINKAAESIPAFKNAVDLEPGNSRFHQNLARVLLTLGKTDEAIAEAQQALRINQLDPPALDLFGRALVQAGRLADARLILERAISLDPSYAPAAEALRALRSK